MTNKQTKRENWPKVGDKIYYHNEGPYEVIKVREDGDLKVRSETGMIAEQTGPISGWLSWLDCCTWKKW